MIVALILLVACVAATAGLAVGLHIGMDRTRDALKLARYRDALVLAEDLTITPGARDLRPRAQTLLAAHRRANPEQEL